MNINVHKNFRLQKPFLIAEIELITMAQYNWQKN